MDECTDQSWFQRYDGAVATREALQAHKTLVAAERDAQLADLYRYLVMAVDGYAMDIRALLFVPKTFDLSRRWDPRNSARRTGCSRAASAGHSSAGC